MTLCYHFDFWLTLAYTVLIERTEVNFCKVPWVISNSINTTRGHSSLPDYCAERDQNNGLITDNCWRKRILSFSFLLLSSFYFFFHLNFIFISCKGQFKLWARGAICGTLPPPNLRHCVHQRHYCEIPAIPQPGSSVSIFCHCRQDENISTYLSTTMTGPISFCLWSSCTLSIISNTVPTGWHDSGHFMFGAMILVIKI